MQTFQSRDGVDLTYAVHGSDGPWLVLCHALLATSAQWEPQIDTLSKSFRVVCPNTRGHGGSEAAAAPYSIDMLVEDLADLFSHLGIERAHLLGASMNGLVVQGFAARYPEKVDHFILANTTWHYPPETFASWDARIATAETGDLTGVVDGTLARFLTDDFRATQDAAVAPLRAAMMDVAPVGFIGCCHALKGADLSCAHGAITAPTLLIAGESDIATTPEVMAQLSKRLNDAPLITMPGAHLCNLESPQLFTTTLCEFLK